VRDDLGVPVLMLETETDLTIGEGYPDMQSDSVNFRLWEVAGAAHADYYVSNSGLGDLGNDPSVVGITLTSSPIPILVTCGSPINAGQQHFVVNAAIAALDNWLRNGIAPAQANRLVMAGNPPDISRDSLGNALGGVRTPSVDAPIATLSGEGETGGTFCSLFGTTQLLGNSQLQSLYPTQTSFTTAVGNAVNSAVLSGFLLPPDGDLINAWAQTAKIGN
jgi:hypothetical protein